MAEFNIQDHLRDMEGRLARAIERVHMDVTAQGEALRVLEEDVEAVDRRLIVSEAKMKWIWRAITLVAGAVLSYFGIDLSAAP